MDRHVLCLFLLLLSARENPLSAAELSLSYCSLKHKDKERFETGSPVVTEMQIPALLELCANLPESSRHMCTEKPHNYRGRTTESNLNMVISTKPAGKKMNSMDTSWTPRLQKEAEVYEEI